MFDRFQKKIKKAKSIGINKTSRILVDKFRKKINMLALVPPTVYIELTDICNLDCLMCDRRGLTRKSGKMDMELYKKIIDNVAAISVPAVKLNRFGETLLHPDLMEMIQYAKEKGVPWVYFTSNATLLNEEKSRQLILSGLDSITFSFDGATKETYEKIRVNANFEEVKDNILTFIKLKKELKKETPRVVINTILSRDTEKEICRTFNLWHSHVDRINIIPVGRYGNVDDLSSIGREGDIVKRRTCHQVFDRLMIFWDGLSTVCCADINGDLSVGNIHDTPIEKLWRNGAFSDIRKKHTEKDFTELPICMKCDSTDAVQFDRMYTERKLVYERAADMGFKQ